MEAKAPTRWSNAENLFAELPPEGTVVGTLTADEFEQMRSLSNRIDATGYNNNNNEGIQLAEQWRGIWAKICKRLDVPYAWPLSFDWNTGKVFIPRK